MSRMIPEDTVRALACAHDHIVDLYGIECTLYIPTNSDAVDQLNVYNEPSDYSFKEYTDQRVYIIWSPDTRGLRKLGIFTEADIPLLAFFKNDPRVVVGSYFRVSITYLPDTGENEDQVDTDEFEVVDMLLRHMHDNEITRAYKCAPRRVKT